MGKNYKHLTAHDRQLIGRLKKSGKSQKFIAEVLGVSASTISREIKRNYSGFGYCCNIAHGQARMRRWRANAGRRKLWGPHYRFIRIQLDYTLSPEQIASLFPNEFGFEITPKTIYRYINSYSGSRYGLEKKLRRRPKVKRLSWRRNTDSKVPKLPRITERPPEVDLRSSFGHWEMDLMEGSSATKNALLVLVERKSLFTIIRRVPNRTSFAVRRAAQRALKPFLVKSVTTDNGSEFLKYEDLTRAITAPIYYCHPYRAWEKGLVENTIGLIRYFFPKGKPLTHSHYKVRHVQDLLNNRPRKTIGFTKSQSLLDKITV